jgi:hypothetical protein
MSPGSIPRLTARETNQSSPAPADGCSEKAADGRFEVAMVAMPLRVHKGVRVDWQTKQCPLVGTVENFTVHLWVPWGHFWAAFTPLWSACGYRTLR